MFCFRAIKSCYVSTISQNLPLKTRRITMPNFSGMSDVELLAWMDNFVSVATTTPAQYGTTKAQVDSLKAKADELRANIAARQTADEAAKAAVASQKASRQSAEPDASYLNTVIKVDPNISDADKQAVGIDTTKPRSKTAPIRPEDLVANGFEDGRNVLKWSREGNKPNTVFIIEAKSADDKDFSYLATATETKYEHSGVKVGTRYTYRVKAQRSSEESTYSNEAVVY